MEKEADREEDAQTGIEQEDEQEKEELEQPKEEAKIEQSESKAVILCLFKTYSFLENKIKSNISFKNVIFFISVRDN